jgi:DNA primase
MVLYQKDSLEHLRQKINLVELVSPYIDLKPAGASYKALCPFHDEKTPSFTIQRGDPHYHCFGCGAHGDAIQFLMQSQKLSFHQSVELLAQKFNVHLEVVEDSQKYLGPSKQLLKEALEQACRLYEFTLLYTYEGKEAFNYLRSRGFTLDFIKKFRIGLSPKQGPLFKDFMRDKKVSDEILEEAGLLSSSKRDFFSDRIMFPIQDASHQIIGFSARKYKEETFGGKYINTRETPLFKKSRTLFGLNFSRKQIAKERQVLIVEGQIDTLRLIDEGFLFTVASQGTAFTEGHVAELKKLGISKVFLSFDADFAGQEATVKVGNLFQKEGIDVLVVILPQEEDPDSILRKEGKEAFQKRLNQAEEYLPFLVRHVGTRFNLDSPAGKTQLIQHLKAQILSWENPLMVHQALKKLAALTKVPEEIVGIDALPKNPFIKKHDSIDFTEINPDEILESDLLRWLYLTGHKYPEFYAACEKFLTPDELRSPPCKTLYMKYQETQRKNEPINHLNLMISLEDKEAELLLGKLFHKKIPEEKALTLFPETLQKILDRNFLEKREALKVKIQTGDCSDDEALDLIKQFDALKKTHPKVTLS